MKTKIILLSLLFVGLHFSCTKTDDPVENNSLLTPYPMPIDMNDDGVIDFKIEYNITITDGYAADMNGFIFPLGGTQFLVDTTSTTAGFLMLADVVEAIPTGADKFNSSILPIIKKAKQTDPEWSVNSIPSISTGKPINPVYIGVRFQNGTVWNVGWVKIQFNLSNGEPSVVAKKSSVVDCLIDQ